MTAYTDLDAIRDEAGKLPAFAWPGGYTIIYLTASNEVLCADCASKPAEEYDDPAVAYGSHDEGKPETCADCGREIESSYGPVPGELIAERLECAEGAAGVALMLDGMTLADVRDVARWYGMPDQPEAPTNVRHREIARRAGWSI